MEKKKLGQEYLGRTAQNILSLEYFNQIIKGLNSSIKVILLKGEALLGAVNDDVGLRRLAEIDILVKRKDFSELKGYLSSRGYRFTENIIPSSDIGYINAVMGMTDVKFWPAIHLHWHLVNNSFPSFMFAPRIDIDQIWNEVQPLDGYDNALKMAPHHQLIYLSEHSLKHSFWKPFHLSDIDILIRRSKDSLIWDRVISEANKFNMRRTVYYALFFTSKILGTKIPNDVIEELKPRRITLLERRFISKVLDRRQQPDSSYSVYLAMNERLSDKIKFIYRTLFPPRIVMGHIENLPVAKVSFVNYLRRITRGIQTIGRLLP